MRAERLKDHRYIEEWEPFCTSGYTLLPRLYQHRDGRKHVYFSKDGQSIQGREHSRNVTRIAYRTWPGSGAMFLGMSAEESLRGSGLAVKLVDFFRNAVEERDAPLTSTGKINKPLVALTLTRAGFEPVADEVLVEILPKSKHEDSEVPRVHFVKGCPNSAGVMDSSGGGRFFDVVEAARVVSSYPINSPEMTVAINTCYLPPRHN